MTASLQQPLASAPTSTVWELCSPLHPCQRVAFEDFPIFAALMNGKLDLIFGFPLMAGNLKLFPMCRLFKFLTMCRALSFNVLFCTVRPFFCWVFLIYAL